MRPKNMTSHLEQAKIKLQQGKSLGATEKARLKARGLMKRKDGTTRKGKLGKTAGVFMGSQELMARAKENSKGWRKNPMKLIYNFDAHKKTAEGGEYDDSYMLSKVLTRMSAQSAHLRDKIDEGLQIPSWAEYKLYNAYDALSKALGTAYPGKYENFEKAAMDYLSLEKTASAAETSAVDYAFEKAATDLLNIPWADWMAAPQLDRDIVKLAAEKVAISLVGGLNRARGFINRKGADVLSNVGFGERALAGSRAQAAKSYDTAAQKLLADAERVAPSVKTHGHYSPEKVNRMFDRASEVSALSGQQGRMAARGAKNLQQQEQLLAGAEGNLERLQNISTQRANFNRGGELTTAPADRMRANLQRIRDQRALQKQEQLLAGAEKELAATPRTNIAKPENYERYSTAQKAVEEARAPMEQLRGAAATSQQRAEQIAAQQKAVREMNQGFRNRIQDVQVTKLQPPPPAPVVAPPAAPSAQKVPLTGQTPQVKPPVTTTNAPPPPAQTSAPLPNASQVNPSQAEAVQLKNVATQPKQIVQPQQPAVVQPQAQNPIPKQPQTQVPQQQVQQPKVQAQPQAQPQQQVQQQVQQPKQPQQQVQTQQTTTPTTTPETKPKTLKEIFEQNKTLAAGTAGLGLGVVGMGAMDKAAQVEYRGKKFLGYNQPIPSDKKDKKKMVLVKRDGKVKVVHYGQKGYQHNYSDQAKKNYLTRSAGIRNKEGKLTKNDPFSPNYWARKDLWPSSKPADGKAVSGLKKEASASSLARLQGISARGIIHRIPYKTREMIFRRLLQVLNDKRPQTVKQITNALQTQFPGLNIKPFLARMLKAKAVRVQGGGFVKTASIKEAHDCKKDIMAAFKAEGGALSIPALLKRTKGKQPRSEVLKELKILVRKGEVKKHPHGDYYTPMSKKAAATATKTNPALWEKSKAEAKARMGGKHSARAMQLATKIYKSKGGGYSGAKPTSGNNSLKKWTKQDWGYSGKDKPGQGGSGVYLPKKRRDALKSSKQGRKMLASAARKKHKATAQGEQYSSHGLAAGTSLKKTASIIDIIDSAKNFNGSRGTNWG